MATTANVREIAARLAAEVDAHGCGRASCYCQDVEDALAPAPERTESRPASVKRTGEHMAIGDGLARQDAAFAALPCY